MKEDLLMKVLEMMLDSDSSPGEDKTLTPSNESNLGESLIGKPVIVRCRDAGVHFGTLVGFSGRAVEISDSRRMWRWHSASENTLSGVSRCGINQEKSKIQGVIAGSMILPEACEILPLTNQAAGSIISALVYNEQ